MMIGPHLPYPALEVLVAGGDDVALVLRDPPDEAVVCVRPLVQARKALEPRVFHDLEGSHEVLFGMFLRRRT